MYEVFDLNADESHGEFETLEQARGCVKFDRLTAWAIWKNGTERIEICEPYTGDDDRAKQGLGEPNASEEEDYNR